MQSSDTNERSVTRTFRAAIRIGEDYITLEETITLPLDASDEDIDKAVAMGWQVYARQREAMEEQVANIRELHSSLAPQDLPASDRQRKYITVLQHDLAWSPEQLAQYAREQGIEIEALSRTQASGFIDTLKKIAEERGTYTVSRTHEGRDPEYAAKPEPSPHSTEPYPDAPTTDTSASDALPTSAEPLSERQYRALLKLAHDRGLDPNAECQRRFGVAVAEISSRQAGELITEWQR